MTDAGSMLGWTAGSGSGSAPGGPDPSRVKIRLVLFDVDGTLIHTRGVGVKAFGCALASEFRRPDVTPKVRFGGRTDPSLVRELFGYAGVEHRKVNVRRFFDAYVFWLDHLLETSLEGGPCPGVWGFLEALRRLPDPPAIGLLTGNIRLGAEIKLRRFGLWDAFELGGFGDDDEDRSGIARAARRRGAEHLGRELRGEEILVVGDTPFDIRCGRAIDARVLAVATGGASAAELERHRPDWLVSTLEGADALALCAGNQTVTF